MRAARVRGRRRAGGRSERRREAEALEDRPRHLPRVRDEHGRAARRGFACPRCDERPVGAAAAGGRKRGAAEEQQAERGVGGVSGRDRLAVDEGEERRAVAALGGEVGLRLLEPDLVGIAAERLVLDPPRPDELVDRRDPPGRVLRRLPRAASPAASTIPIATGSSSSGTMPSIAEPLDEVRRRARLAELPFGAAAAARAEERADLRRRRRRPRRARVAPAAPWRCAARFRCRGRRRTGPPGR